MFVHECSGGYTDIVSVILQLCSSVNRLIAHHRHDRLKNYFQLYALNAALVSHIRTFTGICCKLYLRINDKKLIIIIIFFK